MNRRSLVGARGSGGNDWSSDPSIQDIHVPYRRPRRSHVAILRCDRYERTPQVVEHGLQLVSTICSREARASEAESR